MQLTEHTRELVVPNVTRRFGRPFRIEEVALTELEIVHRLNLEIFEEQRIINTFDREDIVVLLAYVGDAPVAFKIGYRENRFTFYSAKGGVLDAYRRCGIARALLFEMMERARERGYRRFAFDTFPNRHAGMAIMGFMQGFRLVKADYNPMYKDYRLRLEKKL
jgi:GNAT superfamily N-acetyltransferase